MCKTGSCRLASERYDVRDDLFSDRTEMESLTGGIAQLVERQLCKLDVRGSSPRASTKLRKTFGKRPKAGPVAQLVRARA